MTCCATILKAATRAGVLQVHCCKLTEEAVVVRTHMAREGVTVSCVPASCGAHTKCTVRRSLDLSNTRSSGNLTHNAKLLKGATTVLKSANLT